MRIKLWEATRSVAVIALVAVIGFAIAACGGPDSETGPQCACTETVHPYGSPCTCPAAGTSACDCVEEEPPECECIETVHPYSSPCDCPAVGTSACNCTRAEPETLTVTFDADNGSPAAVLNVTEGDTLTRPENPTKSEYGFEYWYNTATNMAWDFNVPITANITLKAKWYLQSLYMEMVYVGGGTFEMGDDYSEDFEFPAHNVTLTGFYIGKYEVTQKQWETVMDWVDASPSIGEGDNYPVYDIYWYDTLEFCNRLSILEGLTPAYIIKGKTDPDEWGYFDDDWETWEAWENVSVVYGSNGYRLPTEAQWEYAAKGGPLASKPYYIYSGSDDVNEVANIGGSLMQVGSLAANQLGLYDMSGNVFEWCWDWYDEEYYWDIRFDPMPNPSGPFSGSDRALRGGSYRAPLKFARSVKRFSEEPDVYENSVGFRVARPAE